MRCAHADAGEVRMYLEAVNRRLMMMKLIGVLNGGCSNPLNDQDDSSVSNNTIVIRIVGLTGGWILKGETQWTDRVLKCCSGDGAVLVMVLSW